MININYLVFSFRYVKKKKHFKTLHPSNVLRVSGYGLAT